MVLTGLGVPNRMSEMSVPIMEPPQPSASEARMAPSMILFTSWSTPMVVRCIISTHFAVDGAGRDAELLPDLLPLLGRPGQIGKFAPLLAELFEELERHLLGDLVHGLALDIDAEIAGNAVQLAHVLDLEILGLAACHGEQRVRQVPGMVRMGRGAGGDHAREVPRRHHRQRRAAYALGLVFLADQTAGSHVAHLAAGALVSDGAGLQLFSPFERGL